MPEDLPKDPMVMWRRIREETGHYPPEAYEFVRKGLAHTVEMVHGKGAAASEAADPDCGPSRHVNGRELCLGLREYAIQRYGPLAMTVFAHWGITRTDDFGRMVFAMIDGGLMSKSDEDSIADFADIYDFDTAFASNR